MEDWAYLLEAMGLGILGAAVGITLWWQYQWRKTLRVARGLIET